MTITVTHSTAADASFSATGAAAWDATHSFAGVLDVANGGTGTATPALVAGTNITITGTWPNQTIAAAGGGGSGTVTSVAATVPSFLSVTGSPITTSGTFAISYSGTALPIANGGTGQTTAAAAITALTGTQTSGYYLRSDGTNATLSAIQAADVPTLNQNTTGTASNVTGTVAIANGGTGATTQQAAINALAGSVQNSRFLAGNGTNVTMRAIAASDVPTLNQDTTGTAANVTATTNSTLTTLSALSLPGSQVSGNISGNAANVTGTIAIGSGGTGQTTASAGFNALSPITTTGDLILGNGANSATRLPIGTDGQILISNGSTAVWGSKLTNGTAVTLTNQTAVDFTGLPSWVKRITFMFNGLSLSGTDGPIVRLGYGGTPTYVTSGYGGGSQSLSTAPASGAEQPGNAFNIQSFNAANTLIGTMTIVLLDATTNTWISATTLYNTSTSMSWTNGTVSLSGTLTALRLTRTGTNTFDAGKVNILYE
jgi:hypothetical protein